MKLHLSIFAWLILLAAGSANAQNIGGGKTVNMVQPKIMVIPFTKEGEDIRTILDNDFNKRLAVAKVKNGFDTRGFTTKDFIAALKQANDAGVFLTGTQADIKSQIIEYSGADIYVEVDINAISSGQGSTVMVLLSAYDAATASAYATVTCDSRERYDTDAATLINVALTMPVPTAAENAEKVPCLDDFLNILQAKFTDIVQNGRPVKVDFSLSAEASRNFDSNLKTAGDAQFSDVIDDWMAQNSFKNNYHLQGQTSVRLFYDEVRIPVLDANGNNFKLNKFGQLLTQFLQKKGIAAKRSVKNGGIYITITN